MDRISTEAIAAFDYAALGHLHAPQRVGSETIRYCGTPYKYSVSEEKHQKGALLVTLNQKGEEVQVKQLPLHGIQDIRRLRGGLEEVLAAATEENRHDFVSITITDDEEAFDLRERLGRIYDHLLELRIDNARTRGTLEESETEFEEISPLEAFGKFYQAVRHSTLSQEEQAVMEKILEEVREVRE